MIMKHSNLSGLFLAITLLWVKLASAQPSPDKKLPLPAAGLPALLIAPIHVSDAAAAPEASSRDRNFDADWRFHRGDIPEAETPGFNDADWRVLDVPHDWSIEDASPLVNQGPTQNSGAGGIASPPRAFEVVGPFTPESAGGPATGHTLGGTGWYRKHFKLDPSSAGKLTSVIFDGIYITTQPGSNPLRDALRPVPETAVFKMDGYYLWDPSLIKVGDTYHLFASRWPITSERMKGWMKSHVIRATSKSLFGPYQFQEIVLSPSNHPWATQAVHNPKVMKTGNRFLIYHLGIPQWKTGFAYADSIVGPWTPVPHPVLSTNNPAIIERPDGSAYAVGKFKPAKIKDGQWDAYMQAFEADSINGPYRLLGGPGNRLPNDFELEDPTLWWAGNRYNVICTDWEAKVTGVQKAVVYYTSKNGIDYQLESRIPVWSQRDPVPLRDGRSLEISGVERPQVFLDENGALVALLAGIYPANREKESTFIVIRPVDHFIPGN